MSLPCRLLLVALLGTPLFSAAAGYPGGDESRGREGGDAESVRGWKQIPLEPFREPILQEHTIELPMDQNVSARVQFSSRLLSVQFLLCGALSCSSIMVAAVEPSGELSYFWGAGCAQDGGGCYVDMTNLTGTRNVPGEYEFVVARHPDHFALWQKGHPSFAATVNATDRQYRLEIKPYLFSFGSTFNVTFGPSYGETTPDPRDLGADTVSTISTFTSTESPATFIPPPTPSRAMGAGRVTGAEAAARLRRCSRVVRGRDWKWGSQDGGGEGRVVSKAVTNNGWVSVRWPSGEDNMYRMGAEGSYDLELLEADEAPLEEADPRCSPDKADSGNKPHKSAVV